MKKLVFLFTMVLAVSMVMAQGNSSTIKQVGNDDKADVTQVGFQNTAKVLQTGGNGNLLGAVKAGDPGIELGSDLSQAKGLVQVGSNNIASAIQKGNANKIQQFREIRNVFNSYFQKGDNNNFAIEQVGDNNVVGQALYEYDALEQVGNWNSADLYQKGNENKISIFYQHGLGNEAIIHQVGDDNKINSASQKPVSPADNANNSLVILQQGNNNLIDNAGEDGTNIEGDILQKGDRNYASMQLSRTYAFGDIDQIGNDNRATLTINESYIGNNNSGVIYQRGDFNTAKAVVGQSNPLTIASDITMDISQIGYDNDANILSEGWWNNATISQKGDNNIGSINQLGDLNVGAIMQTGNSNFASVVQRPN